MVYKKFGCVLDLIMEEDLGMINLQRVVKVKNQLHVLHGFFKEKALVGDEGLLHSSSLRIIHPRLYCALLPLLIQKLGEHILKYIF